MFPPCHVAQVHWACSGRSTRPTFSRGMNALSPKLRSALLQSTGCLWLSDVTQSAVLASMKWERT